MSDIGRILHLVEEGSHDENGWRYSVLCIDGSPGPYLTQRIAEQGKGITHYLGSYPTEDEISEAVNKIFSEWEYSLSAHISLMVNREKAYADRGTVEQCSEGKSLINPGPLISGTRTWLACRCVQGKAPVRFEVAGLSGYQGDLHCVAHSAIKTLTIARCVARLEELKSTDYSPENMASRLHRLEYLLSEEPGHVYNSSGPDSRSYLKNLLFEVSVKHDVLSSETAFFIEGEEHAEYSGEPVMISNALPIGWSDQFLNR
jgi:hypothetical protein